ncbi:MAG TPA: SDR family oxidoreductase, partial [Gemmatimonadaceae bacterium]|nr:SDR family oxidoreductase [Gemmatimonadaceae bacterium]
MTGVGGEGQVGEAVALAFAERGAHLILVDRTAVKVEARAEAITTAGHSARGYACDLTSESAIASLAATIKNDYGDALYGLVHMAGGFAMSGPVAESAVDVWKTQI